MTPSRGSTAATFRASCSVFRAGMCGLTARPLFRPPGQPGRLDFPDADPRIPLRFPPRRARLRQPTGVGGRTRRGCDLQPESLVAGVPPALESASRRYSERQRLAGPTKAIPAEFLEAPNPRPGSHPARPSLFARPWATPSRGLRPASHRTTTICARLSPFREPLAGLRVYPGGGLCRLFRRSRVPQLQVNCTCWSAMTGKALAGYNLAQPDTASSEDLPLVETQRGTGFEVWSLVAEADERFVLPTQVMLAARSLVRNDGQRHFRVVQRDAPKDCVPERTLNPAGRARLCVRRPVICSLQRGMTAAYGRCSSKSSASSGTLSVTAWNRSCTSTTRLAGGPRTGTTEAETPGNTSSSR